MAIEKTESISPSKWWAKHFKQFEESLNGSAGSSFHQYNQKAFEAFSETGFPTPKDEAWKYTNLQNIVKNDYEPAKSVISVSESDISSLLVGEERLAVVFVNGFYSAALSEKCSNLSVPAGLSLQPLAEVLKSKDSDQLLAKLGVGDTKEPLVAFNTALFSDGLYLKVDKGVKVDVPIQLVFLTAKKSDKQVSHPRFIVEADEGSQVEVIEHHIGPEGEDYITSAVGQLFAAKNSKISHIKIQRDSKLACLLSTLKVEQEASSVVDSHIFSFGGKLVRNEVYPSLNGEGIDSTINGLTVLSGDQHVDNYTLIDHAKPNCQSNELFKGIYADKSRGVFGGTIIVRPDAQKTNAIQSNKSLLLSDDASVETRPQLKIWADDVKCTHGATIGQLDEDSLFYLMTRGISKAQATQILVDAFATDVVDQIDNENLVEYLKVILREKLAEILV